MTSDPNLLPFPLVSFLNECPTSVALLPAHLILSCLTTVCLSFHTETMLRMIQPSPQASYWPRGCRRTGVRAEARRGT